MDRKSDLDLANRTATWLREFQDAALQLDGVHVTAVQALGALKDGALPGCVLAPKAMAALKCGPTVPMESTPTLTTNLSAQPRYALATLGWRGHRVDLPEGWRPGDAIPG